jgi:signal transduction histidine kinase
LMKTTPDLSESLVPLERVAKFIRQITHDVRNGLSAVDLEAAFIAELIADPEATEELRRLRGMVTATAKALKELSNHFQPVTVHTMPWQAAMIFQELRERVPRHFDEEMQAGPFTAECCLSAEVICVDLEQLSSAVFQVLMNAFQFRKTGERVALTSYAQGSSVVFEVAENKPDFETSVPLDEWGLEPLRTTRPGGYGLGLFRTRRILEAHGGDFEVVYESGVLKTRLSIPISGG